MVSGVSGTAARALPVLEVEPACHKHEQHLPPFLFKPGSQVLKSQWEEQVMRLICELAAPVRYSYLFLAARRPCQGGVR